jgi:hypothetical protein
MVHWLFVVSTALFVSGIGFIVVGAKTARQAPPVVEAPATTPVASTRQIMVGIVSPAAAVVFDSVATIVSAAGIEERQPKTDEEWAAVGASAAALVESANLLVVGDRAVDRGDWTTMSRALADAGMAALKAAEAKNPEGILSAGEVINRSCDNCHEKYQRS